MGFVEERKGRVGGLCLRRGFGVSGVFRDVGVVSSLERPRAGGRVEKRGKIWKK